MISTERSVSGTYRSVMTILGASVEVSIPRSAALQTVGVLRPCRHDSPQGRVPGLAELVGHGYQGRQVGLQLSIAVRDYLLDGYRPVGHVLPSAPR